jgi:TonB family protein
LGAGIEGPAKAGDKYLNFVGTLIVDHLVYPPQARGLGLSGTPLYEIIVDRSGNILAVNLRESSGSSLIDKTGADAILGLLFRTLIAPN